MAPLTTVRWLAAFALPVLAVGYISPNWLLWPARITPMVALMAAARTMGR